ncbi:hypothetical protein Tco_0417471 [Tanacetum coccineum]
MPRECLKIIKSKSKVRQSRSKAVVAKVSTSSSTPAVSPDVAELKDMVRALILDKKNQTPAPVKKAVEQTAAANFHQGNTVFTASDELQNQIRPSRFFSRLKPFKGNNQNKFHAETLTIKFRLGNISTKPNLPGPQVVALIDVYGRTCTHLEYAFLEGDDKLPVIIAKDLKDEEKAALIKVLKFHKRAIAWKLFDIKGVDPEFCTHTTILIEEDYEQQFQSQSTDFPLDPKDQEKKTFNVPMEHLPIACMLLGYAMAPGTSDLYHEEFADELTHIMSLPNLEFFKFKIKPDPRDLTSIDPGIRKNASTTNVNVPLEDDQSSLFAYVVWIFLAFLTYPVIPPYLFSTGNEDTVFDPGISIYHSFMPDVSHLSETFIKFNVYPNRLNESPMMILPSTCFLMDQ